MRLMAAWASANVATLSGVVCRVVADSSALVRAAHSAPFPPPCSPYGLDATQDCPFRHAGCALHPVRVSEGVAKPFSNYYLPRLVILREAEQS